MRSALQRLRQEDCESKVSLGYMATPHLKHLPVGRVLCGSTRSPGADRGKSSENWRSLCRRCPKCHKAIWEREHKSHIALWHWERETKAVWIASVFYFSFTQSLLTKLATDSISTLQILNYSTFIAC